MAEIKMIAENQIERVNTIINEVKHWQSLPTKVLNAKINKKQWSLLQIVGHMNAAYLLYIKKIESALNHLPDVDTPLDAFAARGFAKQAIKSIKPRGTVRPMKMKTMKRFYPDFALNDPSDADVQQAFTTFFDYQDHIKQSIITSRGKDVKQFKITSAIGPIVRFYLPEAFEFIIGHEERHIIQGQELLQLLD